jgi:hypothetical protein
VQRLKTKPSKPTNVITPSFVMLGGGVAAMPGGIRRLRRDHQLRAHLTDECGSVQQRYYSASPTLVRSNWLPRSKRMLDSVLSLCGCATSCHDALRAASTRHNAFE